MFRVVAFLCICIAGVIFYIGVQPPNNAALMFFGVIAVITLALWFIVEMRRFKGPPLTEEAVAARQAEIAAAEALVGEAGE